MSVQTILVAHDGSEGAAHALDWATALAQQTGARLVVARAWSPLDDLGKHHQHADFHQMHEEALNDLRAACADAIAAGVDVDTRIVEDLPVPGIVATALDCGADLIVCGTRGHGRVKELVLGSVARELPPRSHLPVTIVPPR